MEDNAEALRYVRYLTRNHYENFSVVSWLLPRHLRADFAAIYAFCRTADDLGDEVPDRTLATDLLAHFQAQTEDLFRGRANTAVFRALLPTVARHNLPPEPFLDLISAFQQDQTVTRYDTFAQVVDYCRRSANPVGRLVLMMTGYRDDARFALSDCTCTALQLANFWQDVRRDVVQRQRIYLPRETMATYGVTEAQIASGESSPGYIAAIQSEVRRTWDLFHQGDALLPMLDTRVRYHIGLFSAGGKATLRAIERQGYDTLTQRPYLRRWDKLKLMTLAIPAAFAARFGSRGATP
jgi:squalene synthase HpnC